MADRIVTLPVNPAFASLNLAQAVVIVGYEWFKRSGERAIALRQAGPLAAGCPSSSSSAFFADLERELEKVEFFRPAGKTRRHGGEPAQYLPAHHADPAGHPHAARRRSRRSSQGRKGPARGGVLDGAQAQNLRDLLTEHGAGPRAVRTHATTRLAAAVAAQSDRGRAHSVAGAGQRPPLCRPRLQAAGAGRPARE